MVETKYIKSDLRDGLSLIKAGLNNIVAYVIESKESYTINIPVPWITLYRLILNSMPGVMLDFSYIDHVIKIVTTNGSVIVYEKDNDYEFAYIKE